MDREAQQKTMDAYFDTCHSIMEQQNRTRVLNDLFAQVHDNLEQIENHVLLSREAVASAIIKVTDSEQQRTCLEKLPRPELLAEHTHMKAYKSALETMMNDMQAVLEDMRQTMRATPSTSVTPYHESNP